MLTNSVSICQSSSKSPATSNILTSQTVIPYQTSFRTSSELIHCRCICSNPSNLSNFISNLTSVFEILSPFPLNHHNTILVYTVENSSLRRAPTFPCSTFQQSTPHPSSIIVHHLTNLCQFFVKTNLDPKSP